MTIKMQPAKADIKQKKKLHLAIITQMLSLATSGFGLVAALAWNNVIQEFVTTRIKPFVPGGGLVSLFVYALVITILAVMITYQLGKIIEKLKQ